MRTAEEFRAAARIFLLGAGGMALIAVAICAVLGAWLPLTALLIALAVVVAGWTLLERRAELEVQPQNEIPRPAAAEDPRDQWLA